MKKTPPRRGSAGGDGLAEKWQIDGAALVEKLRSLTFAQEVKLVEQIEAWWAAQRG